MPTQTLINGLAAGATIALMATAFQIVYLPTRVFFLGLAGIYSAAPFIARTAYDHGSPWPIAIMLAVGGCATLSVACDRWCHERLARSRASDAAHLVASLGLFLIIVQCLAIFWGSDYKTLAVQGDARVPLGPIVLTWSQATSVGVSFGLLAVIHLLLRRSELGLRLRALADNDRQFALHGYDVRRHRRIAFGLAGALAAAASLATAYDFGFDSHTGLRAMMLAVVSVIIGGQRSFPGAVLGALLLGTLRAEVISLWSAVWQDAATYVLLVAFLLFRPRGLLTRLSRIEAA